MKLSDLLIPDTTTGSPSTTRSVFLYGSIICILKLLLSGVVIGPLTLGAFSGGDFALALGALGGIYSLDKVVSKKDAQ